MPGIQNENELSAVTYERADEKHSANCRECNHQDVQPSLDERYRVALHDHVGRNQEARCGPELVSKHADRRGRGDLSRTEPEHRQASRHAKSERLSDRTDRLTEHGHQEEVGSNARDLDAGAHGGEQSAQEDRQAQSFAVEQEHGGKDERNVAEHVDHGEPIDSVILVSGVRRQRLVVKNNDHVLYDCIRDPVKGV